MQRVASFGISVSIILYALFHFISYFFEHSLLPLFLPISGLGIFVFTIMKLRISHIKMPFGLMAVGIIIMLISGTSIQEGLMSGLVEMRNVIGLLVFVPMISWVLQEESYIESMMGFAHHLLDTSRKFYFGLVSFTQVIAYFLLFGSIIMMYQLVNMILKNGKGEAWENYKGTALLRGFSLSVMWVVSIPSFAYVVEVMGASLGLSIIQGFGLAICGVIIALIFSHFEEKKYGVNLTAGLQTEIDDVVRHTSDKKEMHQNVIEFFILFATLFGSILILQRFVNIELLVLISVIVILWIMIYYIYKNRPKKLVNELGRYIQYDMEKQGYQLCIMLGAGVLIYALNQTSFAKTFVDGIYSLQEALPFLNILYFLPFIIIILGFFGLGPLTVMVLVAGILESINLPYPPELIVLTVTSGSAISILLSPLIMPLIVLSGANGLSAIKNGIAFNWKYALVIYAMVQVYVQVSVWFS
ncbi:hypothetical protein [Oceanobacillus senegalensis]|uniref:hypothetical protein n=1 Tax=Oceanobacillus senegalensis TaxID=1936063 RepID=UPI000A3144A4|nr:hypothetical protein [Oceanobacillus senegalensis]